MKDSIRVVLGSCLAFSIYCGTAGMCQASERAISTTAEAEVDSSQEAAFGYTVAEDVLPKVLWNHGIIPGVSHTQVLEVPSWDQPGALRIVHLNDGNTANEEITDFLRARYFAYRVFNFTGMMGGLVEEARGQWWFVMHDGKTRVRWTYTFVPKNAFSAGILRTVIVPNFSGYMRGALSRIKAAVESENSAR
jgi:hypothetical protein